MQKKAFISKLNKQDKLDKQDKSSAFSTYKFFYVMLKTQKTSCPFSPLKNLRRQKFGDNTHRLSVEQDLWLWVTVGLTITVDQEEWLKEL